MERRTRRAERLVSRGFVRGALIDPRTDVRHKRHFNENELAALLAAISECRRACIAAQTNATIGGPIYRAVSRLMNGPVVAQSCLA